MSHFHNNKLYILVSMKLSCFYIVSFLSIFFLPLPLFCDKLMQLYTHRTYGSSNSNWYVKFQMFMSARAFWRVSYFAVFYTEYLNFSWYNLIEAYIFSISIGRIIDNQLLQCIYPFILSLGDKNNTPKYRRANVI